MRRQARNRLIDFIHYTLPIYPNPQHQVMLAEKLEQVESGKIKRLMVFMPKMQLTWVWQLVELLILQISTF